jgi:hypothetical protein
MSSWFLPGFITMAVLGLFVALVCAPAPNPPGSAQPAIGGGAGQVPLIGTPVP